MARSTSPAWTNISRMTAFTAVSSVRFWVLAGLPPSSSSRPPTIDRKSVGEGKSVDLGGRRIIKKKKSHLEQGWYEHGGAGATPHRAAGGRVVGFHGHADGPRADAPAAGRVHSRGEIPRRPGPVVH